MEYHLPVMLSESVEGLAIKPGGTYVDATFGGGGHSRAILARLGEGGRLFGFDQDGDAEANVPDDPRFTFIHENFRHLKGFLRLHGVRAVDGVLADLGVSSHQFDVADRGFSIRLEGELDLRMDRRQSGTARDLLRDIEAPELARILSLYGELPQAGRMAAAIVKARGEKPIDTTGDLKEAVRGFLAPGRENRVLAMLFQALRIAVNGELEALQEMLPQAAQLLNPGGRLVVISYHSLEDRLVKNYMKTGNFEGRLEKDFYGNPIVPLKAVTRRVVTPGEEELQSNNRARSAKLRVAEK